MSASSNDRSSELYATPGEVTGEMAGAAVAALPVIGGPIAAIAKGVIERRQSERLNRFICDLAADLRAVKNQLGEDILDNKELQDLIEKTFLAAEQTMKQEKLDGLRAVFLNAVLSDPPPIDEAMEVIDLISQLNPRHMVLLKILGDPRRAEREAGSPVGDGEVFFTSIIQILLRLLPEWNEEEIDRAWETLRREGLTSGAHHKASITDTGIRQLENRLSSWGYRVCAFLRNPASGD